VSRTPSWAAAAALGLAACASLPGLGPRPAWELPPPPPVEAPVVRPGALHRERLDNGLEILVLEDHALPRAALGVTFRRGAAIESRARAGIASFTADLLKRGAGHRDALAFAEWVDSIGASFGASAGWDSIDVGVSGLSRDLDRLVAILADGVLRPRFEPGEAARARGERLAALERAKDDPSTLASWYTARTLYPDHRFGIPISGSPETVTHLDAAAAREFYARVFVPNGAILYAVGDVDAADVAARVRAAFGHWAAHPLPDPGPPPPERTPEARRIVIVDQPELVQARITIAHEGIARTAADRVSAGLMNAVLGGSGFSSRLMEALRSEAGLTYGVWSGFSMRRQPGPFVVSTFTRVPEVRRALDIALRELERGREDPPSEDELRWARTLMAGRFSMSLETSDAVVQGLVDLDVYGLPEDSLDTYRARVRAVTGEQTARAAREHLHPERAAVVLVGPADKIRPQVEDLGPVQVVKP
jgi:zinc protease